MLTLTHATERDVDLLLVEELRRSAAFVRWLVGQVAMTKNASLQYQTSEVSLLIKCSRSALLGAIAIAGERNAKNSCS